MQIKFLYKRLIQSTHSLKVFGLVVIIHTIEKEGKKGHEKCFPLVGKLVGKRKYFVESSQRPNINKVSN